jgi:hypothetical protein
MHTRSNWPSADVQQQLQADRLAISSKDRAAVGRFEALDASVAPEKAPWYDQNSLSYSVEAGRDG